MGFFDSVNKDLAKMAFKGLLANFTGSPRPQQVSALSKIEHAYAEGAEVVVLEGPPGMGKTHIAMACCHAVKAAGLKSYIVTIQRHLQDQLAAEFPDVFLMKGRDNYPCNLPEGKGKTCETGPCKSKGKSILKRCINAAEGDDEESQAAFGAKMTRVVLFQGEGESICKYFDVGAAAVREPITAFNCASFINQMRTGRFQDRALIVFDEAHAIESNLVLQVEFTLDDEIISKFGCELTGEFNTADELLDWADENAIVEKLRGQVMAQKGLVKVTGKSMSKEEMTELKKLQELAEKIDLFREYAKKTPWAVESKEYTDKEGYERHKVTARPVYGRAFFQPLMGKFGGRILAMSATILDKDLWCNTLGLDPAKVVFIRFPSVFPVENRPIHAEYAGSMNFKSLWPGKDGPGTIATMKSKILQISERHHGQRGIVHSHSSLITNALMEAFSSNKRFLKVGKSSEKDEAIKKHSKTPGSILVSHGLYEGTDLKDDLSRFQILVKVPYGNRKDKVCAIRMSEDKGWYAYQAALRMAQAYGRSVRSVDDWAYTYILDSEFDVFCIRNDGLMPDWFMEACRRGPPKAVRKS
jgi:Rad3-related DNA helicase